MWGTPLNISDMYIKGSSHFLERIWCYASFPLMERLFPLNIFPQCASLWLLFHFDFLVSHVLFYLPLCLLNDGIGPLWYMLVYLRQNVLSMCTVVPEIQDVQHPKRTAFLSSSEYKTAWTWTLKAAWSRKKIELLIRFKITWWYIQWCGSSEFFYRFHFRM